MPPKTKAATAKTLIGQPSSVLTDEFLQAVQRNEPDADLLPFSRPIQLPTAEQVVKLFFFFKEQAGLKNGHVPQGDVVSRVSDHVVKYWNMAGFVTISKFSVTKKIKNEVDKYQKINKNKNRDSKTEIEKREDYLKYVKKLFDIAAQNLDDILKKDRLLGNDDENPLYRSEEGYTRKTEDIAFLEDQRGDRKMVMGEKDVTFETRKDASNRKKLGKAGGDKGEVNNNLDKTQNEPDDDTSDHDDDNERDSDFKVKEKPKQKEDTIIIELPKDILNSSEVCAMLDRTATTSRKAVGIVS